MSKSVDYDVIVVGAGVEGSATAYGLAKDNYRTLLLEQFALPHSRGSSHGQSRIIRKSYDELYYTNMMIKAYSMWQQLEKEEGTQLYSQIDLLNIDQYPATNLDKMAKALDDIKASYERIDGTDIMHRFPMLKVNSSYRSILDPEGGLLRADRALTSFWNQFKKHGGTIHDGERLVSLIPGNPVVITTNLRQYSCRSIVMCLGPWTSKIMQPLGLHLPLRTIRVQVYYWKVKTNEFTADKMPSVRGYFDGFPIYGMPCFEYPTHIKFCCHDGTEADPDNRDTDAVLRGEEKTTATLKEIVKQFYPGVEPEPSIRDACMYTITPDNDFVLDVHPQWKNIVVGAGFSGHGFKLAPIVGTLLGELATGRQPSFDMAPFKIDRFSKKGSKL